MHQPCSSHYTFDYVLLILRAPGNCNFLFGGDFELISHCNVEDRQWKFSVLRTLGSTTRVPFSVAAPSFSIALTKLFQITAEAVEELAGPDLEAGVFIRRFMSTPPRIMKRSYPEFGADDGQDEETDEAGSNQGEAADAAQETLQHTESHPDNAGRASKMARTEGVSDVSGRAEPSDPPTYQDSILHAQNPHCRPPSPAPSTGSAKPIPVCAMLFVIYWVGYGKFSSLVEECQMDTATMQEKARQLLREHGAEFIPRPEENNSQECVLDEPSMSVACKRLVSGDEVLEFKRAPKVMDVSTSFGELPTFMRIEVEVTGDPKNIPRPGQRRGLFADCGGVSGGGGGQDSSSGGLFGGD